MSPDSSSQSTVYFTFSAACISKYSAGSIFYYPSFHHVHNPAQLQKLQKDLERYLTRKIGFEAVMRIRCTKGAPASSAPSLLLRSVLTASFGSSPLASAFRSLHPHVSRKLLRALHRPAVFGQREPRLRLRRPGVHRRLSGRLVSGVFPGGAALHVQQR